MKKTLKIVGFVFLGLLIVYASFIFVHETYFPGPTLKFITTCGWDGIIRGVCDKKGNYSTLTKEELSWVIQNYKVSKEEIIEYSKQYIEYRKEQLKELEQKGVMIDNRPELKQIKHLEEIIKTLQE